MVGRGGYRVVAGGTRWVGVLYLAWPAVHNLVYQAWPAVPSPGLAWLGYWVLAWLGYWVLAWVGYWVLAWVGYWVLAWLGYGVLVLAWLM